MSKPIDVTLEQRTERIAQLEAILREFVECPIEFQDERVRYVTMQIDRGILEDARAALAIRKERAIK
jgi:hypothetical protein